MVRLINCYLSRIVAYHRLTLTNQINSRRTLLQRSQLVNQSLCKGHLRKEQNIYPLKKALSDVLGSSFNKNTLQYRYRNDAVAVTLTSKLSFSN